jgi:hypothetical protein
LVVLGVLLVGSMIVYLFTKKTQNSKKGKKSSKNTNLEVKKINNFDDIEEEDLELDSSVYGYK